MAAVYFGSSDADKACDALVSDLLKAGKLLPFQWQVAICLGSLRQSARSAGRGGSGGDRRPGGTQRRSDLDGRVRRGAFGGGRPWVNGTVEPLQNRSEVWKDVDTAVNV